MNKGTIIKFFHMLQLSLEANFSKDPGCQNSTTPVVQKQNLTQTDKKKMKLCKHNTET